MMLPDLTSRLFSTKQIKWFRWSVATASVCNLLVLAPLFFGSAPIYEVVLPLPGNGWFFKSTHVLQSAPSFWIYLFHTVYLLAALVLFNRKWRIPACIVLVFTGNNLLSLCYPYLNMSQYLLLALTTYLLFMDEKADQRRGTVRVISTGLSNTFYIICWAQVLAAYIFPFYYKVQGEMWLNGTALGSILSIPEFSRGFLLEIARPNHWFFMLLTWATLLYQLAFPVLIWWKKAKPYLLLAGVCFNLGIGLFMGLMDIAVVMIAAYSILLDAATVNTLKGWLPFRRRVASPASSA